VSVAGRVSGNASDLEPTLAEALLDLEQLNLMFVAELWWIVRCPQQGQLNLIAVHDLLCLAPADTHPLRAEQPEPGASQQLPHRRHPVVDRGAKHHARG
jgi:hypothetical protein